MAVDLGAAVQEQLAGLRLPDAGSAVQRGPASEKSSHGSIAKSMSTFDRDVRLRSLVLGSNNTEFRTHFVALPIPVVLEEKRTSFEKKIK